ncbi:MAG: hypothetical protein Q8941_18430 [Bacteroidota bacterium]|nr:hypothetical protein [Bacteroidota bacterium]
MKKQPVYFAGIFLLLSLVTTTGFQSLPPVSSANGEGELSFNGGFQHFAFHALKYGDGTVKGSWESKSTGADDRTHGIITCLTILADGKTAIMSGIITQKDGTGFPQFTVGDPVWFKVQDNSEGARASVDMFSDYYMGLSGCVDYGITMLPIENGNIQVKP